MTKFIRLTNLGDLIIMVNPTLIEAIKQPLLSVHGRDANAVLLMTSGKEYTVKETQEKIQLLCA